MIVLLKNGNILESELFAQHEQRPGIIPAIRINDEDWLRWEGTCDQKIDLIQNAQYFKREEVLELNTFP